MTSQYEGGTMTQHMQRQGGAICTRTKNGFVFGIFWHLFGPITLNCRGGDYLN